MPETIPSVRVMPVSEEQKAGRILIIGDSFADQLLKYFRATFEKVTLVANNAGKPDLSHIKSGAYDVVLFQIVERYLSRPLSPITSE